MSCQLLHRIDPKLNMARFYRVEVSLDLFGQVMCHRTILVIIGGDFHHHPQVSATLAPVTMVATLRRMSGQFEAIGVL